jgi:hypothetical protein
MWSEDIFILTQLTDCKVSSIDNDKYKPVSSGLLSYILLTLETVVLYKAHTHTPVQALYIKTIYAKTTLLYSPRSSIVKPFDSNTHRFS